MAESGSGGNICSFPKYRDKDYNEIDNTSVTKAKVVAVLDRVVELDEATFFATARVMLGAVNASLPRELGGNPEDSKSNFDRAIELFEGRYLMARVAYAQYYLAKSSPDRAAYEKTLNEVIDAPDDLFPEQVLANKLAKRKAARWLSRADDIF